MNLPPVRPGARLAVEPAMSVTLHDVAPATLQACEFLVRRVAELGPIPLTLLVAPRYHGGRSTPRFERWIDTRLRRGDELALHGLTHRDEGPAPQGLLDRFSRRVLTDREGEFAALGTQEAGRRLDAGRRFFARRSWPLYGFVPPAWLLADTAWPAVWARPFDYTCTRTALIARGSRSSRDLIRLDSSALVYSTRSAPRRVLSTAWNASLAVWQRNQPWLRIELHPADARHPRVVDDWCRHLRRGRDAGRHTFTLRQIAAALREPGIS